MNVTATLILPTRTRTYGTSSRDDWDWDIDGGKDPFPGLGSITNRLANIGRSHGGGSVAGPVYIGEHPLSLALKAFGSSDGTCWDLEDEINADWQPPDPTDPTTTAQVRFDVEGRSYLLEGTLAGVDIDHSELRFRKLKALASMVVLSGAALIE